MSQKTEDIEMKDTQKSETVASFIAKKPRVKITDGESLQLGEEDISEDEPEKDEYKEKGLKDAAA